MEVYNADEQVKVLKGWWQDNWPALLIGLVLGLGVIAGWRGWVYYSERQAAEAAAAYEQLQTALRRGDLAKALDQGRRLTGQYDSSPYAALGAFSLAAELVRRQSFDSAVIQLQWAASYADDKKFRHMAQLRLARVQWQMGQPDAALATIARKPQPAYVPLYAELRGDIHASAGRAAEARAAYEEALAGVQDPALRAPLQQKLDALGVVASAPANG